VKITRKDAGAILWRGESGGRGVLVTGTEPPEVVELWDWHLVAGEHHESESHTAGTRELLHMQEGSIILTVGEHTNTLNAGDAVSFPGDLPHRYANPGSEPARFSLVVFEPAVGTITRTENQHV
jgi:quercetin dioxygenase-like cupin family protein